MTTATTSADAQLLVFGTPEARSAFIAENRTKEHPLTFRAALPLLEGQELHTWGSSSDAYETEEGWQEVHHGVSGGVSVITFRTKGTAPHLWFRAAVQQWAERGVTLSLSWEDYPNGGGGTVTTEGGTLTVQLFADLSAPADQSSATLPYDTFLGFPTPLTFPDALAGSLMTDVLALLPHDRTISATAHEWAKELTFTDDDVHRMETVEAALGLTGQLYLADVGSPYATKLPTELTHLTIQQDEHGVRFIQLLTSAEGLWLYVNNAPECPCVS